MKYVVDIDGVICNEDVPVDSRLPYKERIQKLNKLFDDGHIIVYFTSRGMRSTNDNQSESDAKYRQLTERQLKEWGAKYHSLFFGKPNADFYIDNKNLSMEEFFK